MTNTSKVAPDQKGSGVKEFIVVVLVKPDNPFEVETAEDLKEVLTPDSSDHADTYEIFSVTEMTTMAFRELEQPIDVEKCLRALDIAIPEVKALKQTNSLAMSILQCVFDLGGNYGRTTIARILTGSVSKKILTINVSKLDTYGVAKETSMKEVLSLVDWLIQENYLAYVEDSEFPVLVVTCKGLDVLGGGEAPPGAKG